MNLIYNFYLYGLFLIFLNNISLAESYNLDKVESLDYKYITIKFIGNKLSKEKISDFFNFYFRPKILSIITENYFFSKTKLRSDTNTKISFEICQNGELKNIELDGSSGFGKVDLNRIAAIAIIKKIDKLPYNLDSIKVLIYMPIYYYSSCELNIPIIKYVDRKCDL